MNDAFGLADLTGVKFPAERSAATEAWETIATYPESLALGNGGPARGARGPRSHGPLVGESPAMLDIADRLRRIAPSGAAVMFVGESGTGKEVAAQVLHAQSARSRGPFLSVNCGAIPASLVEAELFGYERGAFTGAARRHQGYFERASGGTLFLDEITEMPIDLQVKLLRVLESGRIVRVGGAEEIAIDVRIVTATNRSHDDAIRERRLREDLYYRLAVFLVWLPPLRQRGDDIELLAEAFLAELNRENGTTKRFDPHTLVAARGHPWPGNVRELKNCVERSYVLSDVVVRLEIQPALGVPSKVPGPGEGVRLSVGTTMADAERELLLATLRHCGGDKRRTAAMLGVSIKTVYNKVIQYANGATLLPSAGEG